VHARVDGHDVVLRVQDTGAGIAPEHRRRIFDAFFSTKPSKGTGLGLAMLQKIVHTYEGKVDVDSDLGLGTTFCVRVPLRQNEQRVLEQE
jgi:signal transduction histidine kinase